jgi:hypothetical protein
VLYPRAVDRTVENESGGDSGEAQVDRAEAAARSKMVVTVKCLLPVKWVNRVNKETPPRLHPGNYRPVRHQASGLEHGLFF